MLCGELWQFRSDFSRNDAMRDVLASLFYCLATSVSAQSIDPNAPSPVRSNTVTGRIAARDLGDARLTDHYYAFTGTPGDLLITVQSTEPQRRRRRVYCRHVATAAQAHAVRGEHDASHKRDLSAQA